MQVKDKKVNLFIQKLFRDKNVYPRSIGLTEHKDGTIEVFWTEVQNDNPFVRRVRPFVPKEEQNEQTDL